MKELSFERMENIEGGHYCSMICHWMTGGAGYQGSQEDLYSAWFNNCQEWCAPQQQ